MSETTKKTRKLGNYGIKASNGPSNIENLAEARKRRCRNEECKDKLPSSRYFMCYKCQPELGDDVDGVYTYEDMEGNYDTA